jgi:hypothetical protein
MPSKRVFLLGAFAALAASGADARALLQEPGAVAADPADLACGACKKFVAEGEEYINDPSTLDQVGEEIKKLCEDQAGEQAEMVRSVREARARGTRSTRARDPRRVKSDRVASHPTSPRKTTTFSGSFRWCRFLPSERKTSLSKKKPRASRRPPLVKRSFFARNVVRTKSALTKTLPSLPLFYRVKTRISASA